MNYYFAKLKLESGFERAAYFKVESEQEVRKIIRSINQYTDKNKYHRILEIVTIEEVDSQDRVHTNTLSHLNGVTSKKRIRYKKKKNHIESFSDWNSSKSKLSLDKLNYPIIESVKISSYFWFILAGMFVMYPIFLYDLIEKVRLYLTSLDTVEIVMIIVGFSIFSVTITREVSNLSTTMTLIFMPVMLVAMLFLDYGNYNYITRFGLSCVIASFWIFVIFQLVTKLFVVLSKIDESEKRLEITVSLLALIISLIAIFSN